MESLFLIRFGTDSCELSNKAAKQLYDECEASLSRVLEMLKVRLNDEVDAQSGKCWSIWLF